MLKLSDFEFELPEGLIAQYPLLERDQARLLVLYKDTGRIEHRKFSDLPEYLAKGDLLALNNSRVVPARINAHRKSGGKAEILLLERGEGLVFRVLLKPARLRIGEELILDKSGINCLISGRNEVTFSGCLPEDIYAAGSVPLPPYIKREPTAQDKLYYQTVFASEDGSVAAPTAGLHFTPQLLERISLNGAQLAYITLHIGYGTFRPVKSEDITKHQMEPETFSIDEEAALRIKESASAGKRICAVGTTSMRTLETLASGVCRGKTELFIYPGYAFRLVNSLVTNFHLPKTTLLMLVCALGGREQVMEAYRQAVEKKYRFYSYGDAMLII